MENCEVVGKYIIIKDLMFNDFMKDEQDKIKIYDTFEEACVTCGIYELENVLILKVEFNHIEKED